MSQAYKIHFNQDDFTAHKLSDLFEDDKLVAHSIEKVTIVAGKGIKRVGYLWLIRTSSSECNFHALYHYDEDGNNKEILGLWMCRSDSEYLNRYAGDSTALKAIHASSVGVDCNRDFYAILKVKEDTFTELTFKQTIQEFKDDIEYSVYTGKRDADESRIESVEKIAVKGRSFYKRGIAATGLIALAALAVLGGLYLTGNWPFQARKV